MSRRPQPAAAHHLGLAANRSAVATPYAPATT